MRRRMTIIYPDGTYHNVIVTRVDVTLNGRHLLSYIDNGEEYFTEIVCIDGIWYKNPRGDTYFPLESELRPFDPEYSNRIINSLPRVMNSTTNIKKPVNSSRQVASDDSPLLPPQPPEPPRYNQNIDKIIIKKDLNKAPKEKEQIDVEDDQVKPIIDFYVVLYDDGQNTYFYELQNLINDLNNHILSNTYPIYGYEFDSRRGSYEFNDSIHSNVVNSNQETYLRRVVSAISKVISLNRDRKPADRIKELYPSINQNNEHYDLRVNFAYCKDRRFYHDTISRSSQIIPGENYNKIPSGINSVVRSILELISNNQANASFTRRNVTSFEDQKRASYKKFENKKEKNIQLNNVFEENNNPVEENNYRKR